MKIIKRRIACFVVCVATAKAWSVLRGQEPEPHSYFRFFAPVQAADAVPGETRAFQAAVLLFADRGDIKTGVSGWSVSVTSNGWPITEASLMSTSAEIAGASPLGWRLEDGFATVRLDRDSDGNVFALSSCVLSSNLSATMPFTGSKRILQLTLSGQGPTAVWNCDKVELLFRDWQPAGGEAVRNEVSWKGQTLRSGGKGSNVYVCQPHTCVPAYENLILTRAAIQGGGHQSSTFNEGLLTSTVDEEALLEIPRPPEQPGETQLFANIVSRTDMYQGVCGWVLAYSVSGDLDVRGATIKGTASGPGEGFYSGGFHQVRVVDPSLPNGFTGQPQGQGVVATIVLSLDEPAPPWQVMERPLFSV